MTKTVALQKCSEYDEQKVYESILKLMELVPPPDVTGKTVLVKPNILAPKKVSAAVCTNPVVVGAVVKAFLEKGAKRVIAGESPAVVGGVMAAKTTGMSDAVKQNGGEWVDFSVQVDVEIPNGKIINQIQFAKPFEEADIVVSCAKLKTHQLMAYTGAMKNLFGLIVGLHKAQMHYRFPNKSDFGTYLTDLNIAAKPQYAVMDAIVGMEGSGGPGNGDPVALNFLAASDNILALDWICAGLVGYNPHTILNLEDALNRKIWLNSPDEINVVGATLDEVRPKSFKIVQETALAITLRKMLPSWLDTLAKKILVKEPHFNKKKCIKCGRCIEICPPHVLSFADEDKSKKHVVIDRTKCLHCYCCHEVCPVNAIKLR